MFGGGLLSSEMVCMDTRARFARDAAARASVTIRVATPADLPEVLRVQHSAFTRVARSVGVDPPSMSPVCESLEDLRAAREGGVRTLVAQERGRIVGTVRGGLAAGSTLEIGRLAVADGCERRGIGAALMLAIEAEFPEAARLELYTAKEATGPLRLYASLGYRLFREERHDPWDIVWLEKLRGAAAPTAAPGAPLH